MIYAIVGLLIALAIATGWGKIQHSGKLAAEARLETCNAKVAEQNRAVEALAAEGARKTAEGAKAIAKAEGRAKVWTDNAARLQAVLAGRKTTDAQDCKSAWEEIRKP